MTIDKIIEHAIQELSTLDNLKYALKSYNLKVDLKSLDTWIEAKSYLEKRTSIILDLYDSNLLDEEFPAKTLKALRKHANKSK